MSSMMIETSWLPLAFLLRTSRRGPSTAPRRPGRPRRRRRRRHWSLIRPPILYWMPRGGLEPLDQRAPFQVGQHAVQLVGDLLELGQQVLLLLDGLVHLLLGGASVGGVFDSLGLPSSGRHREGQPGRLAAALARRACCSAFSSGGCCDDSRRRSAGSRRRLRLLAGLRLRRLSPCRRRGRCRPSSTCCCSASSPRLRARRLGGLLAAGRRPTASGCRRCP